MHYKIRSFSAPNAVVEYIADNGASAMSYLVFNPKTGQHARVATEQEAAALRDSIVAEMLAEYKASISVLVEELDSDGNAATTPVLLP